jgi:hypothetical protein
MKLALALLFTIQQVTVSAFLTHIIPSQRKDCIRLFYNKNDEEEKSLSEVHRMELVRQLQDLFYKNETSGVDHDHFGVYHNMPILRSQRVELPGFQNLRNITDPLEIHMFLKVVHSPHPKLFGHLYRDETHNEFENEVIVGESLQDKYKVGTLMQVSDYRQDPITGHLLVLVQALARYAVVGSTERWDWMSSEHHSPETVQKHVKIERTVQRASVELLPDFEFVQHFRQKAQDTANSYDFSRNQDVTGAACAGAIAEASQWRFFETFPQRIPAQGQPLDPVASLSPRPFTSITKNAQRAMEEYLSQSPVDLFQGECSLYPNDNDNRDDDDGADPFFFGRRTNDEDVQEVFEMERSVWLELDNLSKNLSKLNPKSNAEMPIPAQILCLMPYPMYWPNDFTLAKYVRQLTRAHAMLSKNKHKLTNGFQLVPKDYPPLRRARRLSYILWNVFLEQDTMDVPSGEMQRVLEIHSTSSRLKAGLLQLQTINRILRALIEN